MINFAHRFVRLWPSGLWLCWKVEIAMARCTCADITFPRVIFRPLVSCSAAADLGPFSILRNSRKILSMPISQSRLSIVSFRAAILEFRTATFSLLASAQHGHANREPASASQVRTTCRVRQPPSRRSDQE